MPKPVTGRALWIRNGDPVPASQEAFAAGHYRVAVLQPWELDVARRLKDAAPEMVLLAYKCFSSVRTYETGPILSSGVSAAQAQSEGWFALRRNGERIEWQGYPGHWQMQVWNADYRRRWCEQVAAELGAGPFDGVLADNDVYDDYYGLTPPLAGEIGMADIRRGLEALVTEAGTALRAVGRILVPNIAESRREAGRWERHAAFGGGLEEMFLAWGPEQFLGPQEAYAQLAQAAASGLTLMRTPTDGGPEHPNLRYGLAATWVAGGAAFFTAGGKDEASGIPWSPELGWDLGTPTSRVHRRGRALWRSFDHGWAGVNLDHAGGRSVIVSLPRGGPDLLDPQGRCAPARVELAPHRGVLLRRSG